MCYEFLQKLNQMRIRTFDYCFKILCALVVFVYSFVLGPYVVNGDQEIYRSIYKEIGNLSFLQAYFYYLSHIDSKEFVHFIISWMFSYFDVNKDFFIAISNSVLAYIVAMLCLNLKASRVIIFILIITSFYMNVLYFPAERLKFGMMFFFLSLIFLNEKKKFYIYLLISSLAHAQILISYMSMLFYKIMLDLEMLLKKQKISKSLVVYIVCSFSIILVMGDHISSKLSAYLGDIKWIDVGKMMLILLFSIYYSKNKRRVVYMFVPLILVVFVIGSDRVFMLGYLLFLYNALQINRGVNFGICLSLVYFGIKSYFFIFNILEYGHPFPVLI